MVNMYSVHSKVIHHVDKKVLRITPVAIQPAFRPHSSFQFSQILTQRCNCARALKSLEQVFIFSAVNSLILHRSRNMKEGCIGGCNIPRESILNEQLDNN